MNQETLNFIEEVIREATKEFNQFRLDHDIRKEQLIDSMRFLQACSVVEMKIKPLRTHTDNDHIIAVARATLRTPKNKLNLKKTGEREIRQKTIILNADEVGVQIIKTFGWEHNWAKFVWERLRNVFAVDSERIQSEMEQHKKAAQNDPEAQEKLSAEMQKAYMKRRNREKVSLSNTFHKLLSTGWEEDDILSVWREASCEQVMDG